MKLFILIDIMVLKDILEYHGPTTSTSILKIHQYLKKYESKVTKVAFLM